jgi:hypothetical protein
MEAEAASIAAYVDASAAMLGMPLAGERRASVIAALARLGAFAADVATVSLADEIEIAGVFVP